MTQENSAMKNEEISNKETWFWALYWAVGIPIWYLVIFIAIPRIPF